MLDLLLKSHRSLRLIRSLIFSFFFCCSEWVLSFILVSSSLILLLLFLLLLFCPYSTFEPIHKAFILVILFFSSKFFIWFSFISSISFPKLSIFLSFVSSMFLIAHWRIFIMAALKSLVENSKTSAILVLASTVSFVWFWVWLNYYSVETWIHFYYVASLWILFNRAVSPGFLWPTLAGEEREGAISLLPGESRNPGSPHGFHWHLRRDSRYFLVHGGESSGSPQSLHLHHSEGGSITAWQWWKALSLLYLLWCYPGGGIMAPQHRLMRVQV